MGQERAGDRSRADVGRVHEARHIAHGRGGRVAHVADRLVDLFAERPARYRLRSCASYQMETAACLWRSPDPRRARPVPASRGRRPCRGMAVGWPGTDLLAPRLYGDHDRLFVPAEGGDGRRRDRPRFALHDPYLDRRDRDRGSTQLLAVALLGLPVPEPRLSETLCRDARRDRTRAPAERARLCRRRS